MTRDNCLEIRMDIIPGTDVNESLTHSPHVLATPELKLS